MKIEVMRRRQSFRSAQAFRPASISLCLIALSIVPLLSSSYPIIAEVEEEDTKCFRFNIPDDDDAHMLFVSLPGEVNEEVEDWFVASLNEMTKVDKKGRISDQLLEMPKEIKDKLGEYDKPQKKMTNVFLKVQKPRRPVLRHQMFKWYEPIVMKDVVQSYSDQGRGWEMSLGGYAVCFENNAEQLARVVFDIVLVSDRRDDDEDAEDQNIIRKEHLTPLEMTFQESITAANQILNEMHYMEKRERRMRMTADSTNVRIRYFSYLSIAILLGVTWMQVTYLKSYFKKIKLM